MRSPVRLLPPVALVLLASCSATPQGDHAGQSQDAVVVNTDTPRAKAQYDADAAFARAYTPRCAATTGRPRVIVTGFGRFQWILDNVTGRIVSHLVPGAAYPETTPAKDGEIDPPGPQTSVAVGTITLPNTGDVDVCAMILPVHWDLAAILIVKEIQSFDPQFVMMDGVASEKQPLWLELGSVNRAMTELDGSEILRPLEPAGEEFAPIIESAAPEDTLKGLLLSYDAVERAAKATILSHADHVVEGRRFDAVLQGVKLTGFPRNGNTYLCNNVSYVTNYLMANPGHAVALLSASTGEKEDKEGVRVAIDRDVTKVPRVFVHWPSTLTGAHVDDATDVMRTVIDAQLVALGTDADAPIVGTNSMAEVVASGPTF